MTPRRTRQHAASAGGPQAVEPPGGVFPGRVAGERPGHAATTAHLQAAYPFVAEGGLGGRGVYVGRDAYGGSFVYDP